MSPDKRTDAPIPGQRPTNVFDLRTGQAFRPSLGDTACQQVALARRRAGLTTAEFAEVIGSILSWKPTAETIESWETGVVPPGDVLIAVGLVAQTSPPASGESSEPDLISEVLGRRLADVEAVFPTRSEFASKMPPHAIFDNAKEIKAAGLSLNLLCQQYADEHLRHLLESGSTVQCLFLDPKGEAIKAREKEEGHRPGHLSMLTDLNIQMLDQRVRQRLPEKLQGQLQIAVYDETIRFNITIIDSVLAVVQPYLHTSRGLEAPTLVLRNDGSSTGLFPTFEQAFNWLWEKGRPYDQLG